ncbi:MAG TPA: hypothetical protein VKA03_01275 [Methylovirgula sp.]|nr:hypothetical protein [Methylovirgula sp.]
MQNSTIRAANLPPADAAASTSTYSPEWHEAQRLRARKHFEQLYSNWLTARGDHANPAHEDDDEAARLRSNREDEAARLLFVTPAVLPFMVWQKIEAFEFYFCGDGECRWTDRRQVAFFGCIKADLARFGIGGED